MEFLLTMSFIFFAVQIILSIPIQAQESANCSAEVEMLYAVSGTWYSLKTPGYTEGGYSSNSNCQWLIEGSPGTRIVLDIHDSRLDDRIFTDCDDFVAIRDGDSIKSSLLVQWCGFQNPLTLSSTSNQMFIQFKSDPKLQYRGVNMSFTQYPASSCPPRWNDIKLSEGSFCYRMVNPTKPLRGRTWVEAQKHCSYEKSNLAVFQTVEEFRAVFGTYGKAKLYPWIGIMDSRVEGEFRAVDQTTNIWPDPFPTFVDHSLKDCIYMDFEDNTSSPYAIDDCRKLRPFLCKKRKDGTTSVYPSQEDVVRDGIRDVYEAASFPYWIWLIIAVVLLFTILLCIPLCYKKYKSNRVSSATASGNLLVDNIDGDNKEIRVEISPRRGSNLLDALPPLQSNGVVNKHKHDKTTWKAAVDVFSTASGLSPRPKGQDYSQGSELDGVRRLGQPYPKPMETSDRFDRPHVKPLDAVSAISLDEFWKGSRLPVPIHVKPYQDPNTSRV